MKKILVCTIAIILICGCFVGTTIAWLMDQSDRVENTFTAGDIEITLTETTGNEYKMVPGNEITKDPKVTVLGGSEACYLFVVIEESPNFDIYMTYDIAEGWTELAGYPGVYYRKVDAVAENATAEFPVLLNNKVVVSQDVTADQLEEAELSEPSLSFIALAVQQANIADEQAAWNIIKGSFNP